MDHVMFGNKVVREDGMVWDNHKAQRRASSDDEKPGSRGSSKLERWTGNNERDFSIISKSSSTSESKDIDTHKKVSDQPPRSSNQIDTGGAQVNNADEKTEGDKHLDTVAKLKNRSERFKLPMPSDKYIMAIKKMECETFAFSSN
ncbi:FIP1[V]-like protein [Forsythia ovata]|uniref:FIP1[V]-like protein n=1 Tax=Forsythia ovata TaxID=205694 RepID=A0ABD1SP74_9LAMI